MAYFYLIRSFGAVPIIYDNTDELNSGNCAPNSKWRAADVRIYHYDSGKLWSLLPPEVKQGRIDRYCTRRSLLARCVSN